MGEPNTTFDIISGQDGAECFVEVTGDIDRETLPRLRGALWYAIAAGPTRVIVVLARADRVDASALAVLARARQRGLGRGVSVLLQAPNAGTIDLLVETGLNPIPFT